MFSLIQFHFSINLLNFINSIFEKIHIENDTSVFVEWKHTYQQRCCHSSILSHLICSQPKLSFQLKRSTDNFCKSKRHFGLRNFYVFVLFNLFSVVTFFVTKKTGHRTTKNIFYTTWNNIFDLLLCRLVIDVQYGTLCKVQISILNSISSSLRLSKKTFVCVYFWKIANNIW